jgi:hypothetical protein
MTTYTRPPERGFLRSLGLHQAILVEFQFNPTQLSDKRAVSYAMLSAPGQLLPDRQYTAGGDRTISFTVRVDGLFRPSDNEVGTGGAGQSLGSGNGPTRIQRDETGSIEPELNKYRAFLYPQPRNEVDWRKATRSFTGLYRRATPATESLGAPPLCEFGMGGRVITCIVTDLGVTETLFNRELRPLRADVAITLVEHVPYDDRPGT